MRALLATAVTAVALIVVPTAGGASAPTWVPTEAPAATAGNPGDHLNAVSCWSLGNCVAVGHVYAHGVLSSLIDQETDGRWAWVQSGGSGLDLTAVSCPAAGSCVAVGTANPGTNYNNGELVVQSRTGWTTLAATGPNSLDAGSYTGGLTGVDCPAVNSCVAVGQAYDTNENSSGFTLTLKPGSDATAAASWTAEKAAEPQGDSQGGLSSVSCVSAGNCTAVGFSESGGAAGQDVGLIENERNYAWGLGGSYEPTGSVGRLTSISCIAEGAVCQAGGRFSGKFGGLYGNQPVIATIDTKTATFTVADEMPAGFSDTDVDASSCAPDGQCQSVGLAYDNSAGTYYGYNGLIISTRYGTGSPSVTSQATVSPADANTVEHNENLNATSCASGGFCVSVGYYVTTTGAEAGVIDTRTYSGTGAITGETDITAPTPANDGSDDDQKPMTGADCLDATHCVTVGTYYADTDDKARGVIDTLGSTVAPTPKPTVTKVGPTKGPAAGGTTVTITGTHLTGATAVKFGSTAGTKLTVVSSTKLTVRAPKHAAGRVDVHVTTKGGTSAPAAADRYTYVSAPTVTKVGPASGSHKGGTKVVVTGTNLTGATRVLFGSVVGTKVKVVSSTTLDVTAPAHAKATVDVVVTTAGGTSAKHTADHFRYR